MKNPQLRDLLREQYEFIQRHEEGEGTDEYWGNVVNDMTDWSKQYPDEHPLHDVAWECIVGSTRILEKMKGSNKQ